MTGPVGQYLDSKRGSSGGRYLVGIGQELSEDRPHFVLFQVSFEGLIYG